MIPAEIFELIKLKALFIVNHSGGKDSQAMTILLRQIVPDNQLLVIHADLPGVDWEGCIEHITDTTNGLEFQIVRAGKTFFEMVKHRQMWPSPKYRQCTSDLKRGPIEKAVRHAVKSRDNKIVVNCMGMRAQESSNRKKLKILKLNTRNSKAGRSWFDWLPIHSMLENEVFQTIVNAGQIPHWAYSKGMSRLSCCFCIMASKADMQTAARLQPKLYAKYCAMEREIDHTFIMPTKKGSKKFLPEITGIKPKETQK